MKFLISTSDTNFYLWQILTQINNFKKFGYDVDTIYVIASNKPSDNLNKIISKTNAKFYIYEDTRSIAFYPSSVRLHILEKFYKEHPEMNDEVVFYIDPDVLFTRPINFETMLNDDNWYVSDTKSYIGAEAIKSKGFELLPMMCKVIGIDEQIVLNNESMVGGAQYLIKGIDYTFWKKCYIDSEILYHNLKDNIESMPMKNPIQIWCADMWVVLWNAWLLNMNTIVSPELAFSWTHYPISEWDKYAIYHNAGVTRKHSDEYFKKNNFINESPFKKDILISPDFCGWKHLQEIKDTEQNFSDIIW